MNHRRLAGAATQVKTVAASNWRGSAHGRGRLAEPAHLHHVRAIGLCEGIRSMPRSTVSSAMQAKSAIADRNATYWSPG
jgi:hypothetical protein